MALKRWHRVALTAAGMTLAAVVILPPRPLPLQDESGWQLRLLFEGRVSNYWGGGANYRWTLSRAVSGLRNRVSAARKADSLLELASGPRALHSADGALTVEYEPPLTADSARVWLRMLERELALAPRVSGGGMPAIVALHAVDQRRPPGPGPDYVMMRFLSPRAERPACMVSLKLVRGRQHAYDVTRLVVRDRRTGLARTTVLDRCLVYARFGTPGPHVAHWMGAGVQLSYSYSPGETFTWALDEGPRSTRRYEGPAFWRDYRGLADPLYAGCVRGSETMCLKGVGLTAERAGDWDNYWGSMARPLFLASLMLKDPERFGRFWRSSEPTTVALEEAYGRPAATLVADWERSFVSVEATGPRAPTRALLSSLGWAALAIGLGLLMAGRRQVGS